MNSSFSQYFDPDALSPQAPLASLLATVLESFLPGYSIFSKALFQLFGIDVGLALFGCLLLLGLVRGAQFFYRQAYDLVIYYLTSSIQVDEGDQIYQNVMGWVTEQRMTKRSRCLIAVTKRVGDGLDADDVSSLNEKDALDNSGIVDFRKWSSKISPKYEPNYGSNYFWHKGRLFLFAREKRDQKYVAMSGWSNEFLVIRCFGCSTQPIKELISYAKSWTLTREERTTSIFRPAPKLEHRRRTWERQARRPSRPISSVSLDQKQKTNIVRDISEYLQPRTALWYAARGIPHRRGYLFYGPPGTGKSSMSFALAGVFGLDMYCVSLNEFGLTESDLGILFSALPQRCIVLLEDIDSAGLRRDNDAPSASRMNSTDFSDSVQVGESTTPRDVAVLPGRVSATNSSISLSGLLNVIDGTASHEGRVLIMTTNHPETLDSALIRPGRVDLEILFDLASRDQIRDIFERMYTIRHESQKDSSNLDATSSFRRYLRTTVPEKSNTRQRGTEEEDILDGCVSPAVLCEYVLGVSSIEELANIAKQFADKFPERMFSPAKIQGYLLKRKNQPCKALEEVDLWISTALKVKQDK